MRYKLRLEPEQVVERVREMVSYAAGLCDDVEFSPEDAGRSDPRFLYLVLEEAIKAGATTINIPDTVGYTTPEEFGRLISGILENTPGIEQVIVSVHCHDDLGMATANTLAGIQAVLVRLKSPSMASANGREYLPGGGSDGLHTRRAVFGLETSIDTTQIARLSRMVSNYTGILATEQGHCGSQCLCSRGWDPSGWHAKKSTYL
jgi:2-isopropylmalate synthase